MAILNNPRGSENMMEYIVNIAWDDESRTWIATSEDIPGLCCEAATFEELAEAVIALAPDLLEANGIMPDSTNNIPLRLSAERHVTARALAQ